MPGRKQTIYDAKPFIYNRADPYIIKAENGYYFTASVPEYDRIILRFAETIDGLKGAEETVIWQKHETGEMSANIWAPELHFLFGKWYIYFSAGKAESIFDIRPYVLECQSDDPLKGPWTEMGKMKEADEDEFSFRAFSLDATVFENKGKWYYIWAEKVGVGKQISNLYIARMKSAAKLDTVQVMLTTPDYDWERGKFWVDEAPGIIKRNNRIYMTFSASDTGPSYCVGLMSIGEDEDLLDPALWKKERYPVLKSDEARGIFGPGHNSFTVNEDGEDVLVYHARFEEEIKGDPLFNPNRHTCLMKFDFDENGPVFKY